LFRAAGIEVMPHEDRQRVVDRIAVLFQKFSLDENQQEAFQVDLEQFLNRYAHSLEVRNKTVQKVVITCAGWQRFLAPDLQERMLLPAVAEAVAADLDEIILVTASDDFPIDVIKKAFVRIRDKKCTIVKQEQPLGLGHALWTARERIKDEPFALLLPDEIDR